MAVYLVDRLVPGMTLEQLAIRQQAVLHMIPHFVARGKPVQEVNEAAQFPFARIIEALELDP